jgi:hypothetical protein
MATLEDIVKLEPTKSANSSMALYAEVLRKEDWRCYTSKSHPAELESLIRRYLGNHSRIPGIFPKGLPGIMPIEVLGFKRNGLIHFGVLYANGAVLCAVRENTEFWYLFVDEDTAKLWGYPTNSLSLDERFNKPQTGERDN